MAYLWSVPSTDWVTCSWQCHRNRNPPSSEAGTDIGCGYGAQVVAPDNGTITYIKTSNSNATGRVVEYRLDDGRDGRVLHMSEIWVSVGQRISRGQVLGLSGASGYGDNWYYGPHAHQTLWPGHAWDADTIDFQRYVGSDPGPIPGPTPPPSSGTRKDNEMYLVWYGNTIPEQGWLVCATAQVGVSSEADYNLLKRVITSDQNAAHPVHFNYAERDVIGRYVEALAKATAENVKR